jgi:hypothetical protein
MSVQDNVSIAPTDDVKAANTPVPAASDKNDSEEISIRSGKELDLQRGEEAKLLNEVIVESDKADDEAESRVKEQIGEARLSRPKIELPEEVIASGVRSRAKEASEVIVSGGNLVLPISEQDFQKGEDAKISGKSDKDKDVRGVLSISVFAMFISRLIKMAHKHARAVIFRKGGG